jgi:hypothetical protein
LQETNTIGDYNAFYIAQLLKNLGFSYQKAAFVSDHLDERKQQERQTTTWPQILRVVKAQKVLLLFGDEASFSQWGMFTYTWARCGQPPMVKTSGKRKGYKVFGLIDSFTGRFFYQGQEGRLNSAAYIALRVWWSKPSPDARCLDYPPPHHGPRGISAKSYGQRPGGTYPRPG